LSLPAQVAILLGAAVLFLVIGFCIRFFRHPIATTVWFRRKQLQRAGFAKATVETTKGPQTVWYGGSGPLLVLLHGAGDQAGTWYKIAPDLAKQYSLVMPDLAGHGQSAPSSGSLGLGMILDALEQVLGSATWSSHRFVLAGNSMGAWIAMLYARKHPERVSRLLLIDGGALKHNHFTALTPKTREEARRAFDAVLDPASPRPPAFVLDDLVRVTSRGTMARLMASIAEASDYVLDGKLGDFPVPVDIVWGASDRLIPLDYARRLEAQLPAARLTVIKHCGHAPQVECPGRLLEVLLSLLAEEPPPYRKGESEVDP